MTYLLLLREFAVAEYDVMTALSLNAPAGDRHPSHHGNGYGNPMDKEASAVIGLMPSGDVVSREPMVDFGMPQYAPSNGP